MDANRLLERLCARHGLAPAEARPLLPLVERALESPAVVRDDILRKIDESLRRRAGGDASATYEQLERDLDEEVLCTVARMLHAWEPSRRVRELDGDGNTDGLGDGDEGYLGSDFPRGFDA